MLYSHCTSSILQSNRNDKPASKSSPFVFQQTHLFSPLATTHWLFRTWFKKPNPSPKLPKSLLSTRHSLHSVSNCTGFYVIYLFYLFLLLQEHQPELWRELTIETSRNREMLRKAVFSHPPSTLRCTLVWVFCQDPSCKSEVRHSLSLSATSPFGAWISSTLFPDSSAVCFLPLEWQMEGREGTRLC